MARYLYNAAERYPRVYSGFTNGIVKVVSPSLSRVYHTGRRSAVGNVHSSISTKRPWGSDKVLLRTIEFKPRIASGVFNYFGLPCTFPQEASTVSQSHHLSEVLENWVDATVLNIPKVFKNTQCFFRDKKRSRCDPIVDPVHNCRDQGSYLFPLGLRYTQLTLEESLKYWEQFGPAWSHMTEERLNFIHGK